MAIVVRKCIENRPRPFLCLGEHSSSSTTQRTPASAAESPSLYVCQPQQTARHPAGSHIYARIIIKDRLHDENPAFRRNLTGSARETPVTFLFICLECKQHNKKQINVKQLHSL